MDAEELKRKKNRTRSQTKALIRTGALARRPCAVCGEWRHLHVHHWDYDDPTDISWLCPEHHQEVESMMRMGVVPKPRPDRERLTRMKVGPPRPPYRPQTRTLHVRFTETEFAIIEAEAHRRGLHVEAYANGILLNGHAC